MLFKQTHTDGREKCSLIYSKVADFRVLAKLSKAYIEVALNLYNLELDIKIFEKWTVHRNNRICIVIRDDIL